MTSIKPSRVPTKFKISRIETKTDCLADRGGLTLSRRYLDHTDIVDELGRVFKGHQANKKGLSVNELIRQVLGFLTDGTHSKLTHLELLKDDLGYRGVMETPGERLASSHQVKRFFNKFTKVSSSAFRRIL